MGFKFEKIKVWQKAVDFTVDVHNLTRKFPKDELYVLSSQIKRAADSIALNIAEGSTGQTNAELSKFLGYSLRSAIEVVSCLWIGKKRSLIDNNDFQKLYAKVEILIKMLQAFRNSIK